MKLIVYCLFFLPFNVLSQSGCSADMDSTKHLETIIDLTKQCVETQLVVRVKVKNDKIQRVLLSNVELSRLYGIDFCNLPTYADTVSKILKVLNIESYFSFKLDEYQVSDKIYADVSKYSPCEVYNKYFDERGMLDSSKYFYYGELRAIIAYLIDNYAVIISNHLTDFCVMIKPCCLNCKR